MSAGLSAAEIAGSPSLYPQKLDIARDALFLTRMAPDLYRSASFLDDRILPLVAPVGWSPFAAVEAASKAVRGHPLHFIFHAGHVGSTLLSRLLDEVPGTLGLREPLPLRSLAEGHDTLGAANAWNGKDFEARLATFLRLWSRGYPDTQRVIVKATSTAGRIAPQILAAAPGARGMYLNLKPEPYIATLLAGSNARADLAGLTTERIARVTKTLGSGIENDDALSLGESAALAWLAERLAEQAAQQAAGPRLLPLDFENFLSDVESALARVFDHFGLPRAALEKAVRSPMLSRYSKLPDDHAYSPQLRREMLDQARRFQAGEIRQGLDFLDRMGARHAAVAQILSATTA